jgi:hypothetical protein
MNRQKLLLIFLLAVLVFALAYAFWKFPRQERVALRSTRSVPALDGKASLTEELRVRLDLMTRERKEFPGYKQDIFRPLYVVKLPSPPPPVATTPSASQQQPPKAVQKELASFTFLGFLQKEAEKTIFLGSEKEIFIVKKGDRFGKNEEFYVADLTSEKLIIRQRGDSRMITIPLVEQIPLNFSGAKDRQSKSSRRLLEPIQKESGGLMQPLQAKDRTIDR